MSGSIKIESREKCSFCYNLRADGMKLFNATRWPDAKKDELVRITNFRPDKIKFVCQNHFDPESLGDLCRITEGRFPQFLQDKATIQYTRTPKRPLPSRNLAPALIHTEPATPTKRAKLISKMSSEKKIHHIQKLENELLIQKDNFNKLNEIYLNLKTELNELKAIVNSPGSDGKMVLKLSDDESMITLTSFDLKQIDELYLEVKCLREEERTSAAVLSGIAGFKLYLIMLRTGQSYRQLHTFCKFVGYSYFQECMSVWEAAFHKWASMPENEIRLLSVDEWKVECESRTYFKDKSSNFYNTLMYFVDGSPILTYSPTSPDAAKRIWNTKYQHAAFYFYVMVAPTGKLVFISTVGYGNTHDTQILKESKLINKLENHYGAPKAPLKFALGGDKGYKGIVGPKGWRVIITKSGMNDKKINEWDGPESNATNEYDPSIAQHRAVVERTIGRIKDFRVFSTFHHTTDCKRTGNIFKIVCSLFNKYFEPVYKFVFIFFLAFAFRNSQPLHMKFLCEFLSFSTIESSLCVFLTQVK